MLDALKVSGFCRRNQRGRGPAFAGADAPPLADADATPLADAVGAAIVVVDALALAGGVVGAGVGASFDFDLHAPIAISAPATSTLRIAQSYQYVPSSGRPRVSKAQ
jgi:hypothetical protein